MTRTLIINTRQSCGGYTARALGEGITASSTCGPREAAERVALKVKLRQKDVQRLVFEESNIRLDQVTDTLMHATFEAQWEEEAA